MPSKVSLHKIKKIYVSKSDEVALVVEKIIDSDAKEVVLSIPRFSKLSDSLANFHLIKRESELLSKKIIVESVDDKVIELSGLAGLESLNPILSKSRRQFSDIVSTRHTREEVEETEIKTKKLAESVKRKPARAGGRGISRSWIAALGVLVVLGGGVALAMTVLPKAEIKITTKKSNWNYSDAITAQKLAAVDSVKMVVPAQIFNVKRNLQLSFPASGKKSIAQKAAGKITIYNAYSSDAQPLVATTRFVTPDGKIFRLASSIVVPAAKIIEGKIIPSTFEADVVADKAGADYNVGPVSHFTIPGFKGTPKYDAFYGESKAPMTGGFVGQTAYPTDADLKLAKGQVTDKIRAFLKDQITGQVPAEFKVIDGATSFNVLKQNVIAQTDGSGNFSISADAEMNIVAFKEADVLTALAGRMKKDVGQDYATKTFELSYGKARPDFTAGKISFPVTYKSVISKLIDPLALRQQVKGKSETALKSLIYGLPDLQSAVVSLWPFWVKSVPSNEAKITITIE